MKHDCLNGKKAEPVIPQRIIEQQSTRMDAVSGATNSSNVIMNAVHKAVEKAKEWFPIPDTGFFNRRFKRMDADYFWQD